ncbi:uroporphyrinogen-III synthase [Drosophila subpulchrella]|uniref:uroporphyrinogen-III synthase n=1 Tax=Drosophila subpulchrella TaxID=1486046 RepID=UPI0018A12E19|nr:uroporphyrinogen-III synthase [Drosophila subpulchrella]
MTSRQRTVIIFKSESESSDLYAETLERHDFNPVFVPTLSFGFKNLEQLRAKLQTPDKYAGIIFTSPRCVEAVAEALSLGELPGGWKMLHNYAVGEVTHNLALSSLDQLFTHGKQTGNARALGEYIVDTFDGSRALPLLLPCGNLATDTLLSKLAENGFSVDACEVYETRCHPDLGANVERALEVYGESMEFLAFFSPSGVNCAQQYFGSKQISMDKWKLVAIGPSTRRALESQGLKVYCTAERPTVEHLVKVLLNPQDSRERLLQERERLAALENNN